MQAQYLYLNSDPNTQVPKKNKGFKKIALVLAGTVAVAGAIAATMAISGDTSAQDISFFGEGNAEKQQAFMTFLAKYGKTYASKHDVNHRYETFSKNYDKIEDHNAKSEHFKMAVNKFADLTEEEFHTRYLSGMNVPARKLSHPRVQVVHQVDAAALPESVDWHAKGKVSTPGDQSSCGSCWAWTTASTLESLAAIKHNMEKPPKFSVQYMIDCDKDNFGCDGGWMLDAYTFTKKNGIAKDEDYQKYHAKVGQCKEVDSQKKFYNTDQQEEDNVSNERLKELLTKQPVGIAIYSNPRCLSSYSHGVIKEEECTCSDTKTNDVNHGVTLVGYGKSERPDCQDFWLIKNSWGADWGESGFFRLCADKSDKTLQGTCQVNSYVQYPQLD